MELFSKFIALNFKLKVQNAFSEEDINLFAELFLYIDIISQSR
jgi:hypothetical protein